MNKVIRISDDVLRISDEVFREGGEAERKLCEKCRWEQMGRCAVIQNWGDPRKWNDDPTKKEQS